MDMAHQIQVMDLLVRLKQGRVVHVGTPDAVLTFETLEEAYGCCVLVDQNPLGDFPRIMPVPGRLLPKHKEREI